MSVFVCVGERWHGMQGPKRVPMVELGHGVSLRHTLWQWQTDKGLPQKGN